MYYVKLAFCLSFQPDTWRGINFNQVKPLPKLQATGHILSAVADP